MKTLKKLPDAPVFLADSFFAQAPRLRKEFEKRFENPLETSNDRFVWDYWNVPGQYRLLRTPAYHFFSENLYRQFHESLLEFGRSVLGCYDVTPPWLSYYIDGCRQELHADVPHGPWAYVYSLTLWNKRKFSGGETLLLKSQTLNYWKNFSSFEGVEANDLTLRVPAQFNRLIVFDPRIPHGVTPVHGIHDPREARLVVHGWFTKPEPYVVGSLTRTQATRTVNSVLEKLHPVFSEFAHVHGSLSLRFHVSREGRVSRVKPMTNTLLSLEDLSVSPLLKKIRQTLVETRFPKSRGSTVVTFPLVFR